MRYPGQGGQQGPPCQSRCQNPARDSVQVKAETCTAGDMCKVSQPGNGTDLPEQGLGREKPNSDQLCCYQGLFAGEREVLIVLTQTPSAANLALTPHTGLGRIGPVAPRDPPSCRHWSLPSITSTAAFCCLPGGEARGPQSNLTPGRPPCHGSKDSSPTLTDGHNGTDV